MKDDEAQRRAERQAAKWICGVSHSHAALEEEDLAQWQRIPGEQRFRLTVELGRALWIASRPYEHEPTDAATFGVRRMHPDE